MVYRVIGTMSGSSLDGLDIAFVEFQQVSGRWTYNLRHAECYPYTEEWSSRLSEARQLNALEYLILDAEYGEYMGNEINRFIAQHTIQYQVQLIASHGHTVFHVPEKRMTAQLGSGAAIAAITGINVVNQLRSVDMAFGGQGAPIVPIGEKLLLGDYRFFLNLGGIANISLNYGDKYVAYDICPANKVLNALAEKKQKKFDDHGLLARRGTVNQSLLENLNDFEYFRLPYPKSLSNDFGTDVIYPLIEREVEDINDALSTYVELICQQIRNAIRTLKTDLNITDDGNNKMLVTGGGAKNEFLIERLHEVISDTGITIELPPAELIDYKEAIIMGLIGVLRWREENNTLASVTGASRDSIGGAVWIGQEA